MEKKNQRQANAPELQQVLASQQPPHNPYYPELPNSSSQLIPPPPYSDSSASNLNTANSNQPTFNMSRTHQGVNYTPYQHQPAPRVVIQQVPYDHRADRYNSKVKSFNTQLVLIGIIACVTSVWAYNLYDRRPCIFNFTVHKPNKDLEVAIKDVRNGHILVTYISIALLVVCTLKSLFGFRGKSHSCFLFLVGMITLAATLITGYLAYLTFYSSCVLKVSDIASNISKTVISSLSDTLPSPDRGIFGESNVIQLASEDKYGALIFIIDMVNFAFYFGAFLSASFMC